MKRWTGGGMMIMVIMVIMVVMVGVMMVTMVHGHPLVLDMVEPPETGKTSPHPQLPVDALPGVYQDACVHKVEVPGV